MEDYSVFKKTRPFRHRIDGQLPMYVSASYWRMSISIMPFSINMSARTTRLVAKVVGIGFGAMLVAGFILPQLLRWPA